MTQNLTKPVYYFRHGVVTLSAALALAMMQAIPVSAQEILFSPGQSSAQGDIGEFEISPDGTQVAFSGTLDNGLTPGQQTYVAGLNFGPNLGVPDGSTTPPRIGANVATRVDPTDAGDNDGGVRWTPDGLSVITRYDMGVAGGNEIYRLPADGSQAAQQLSFNSDQTGAFDPRVSSDGSRVFYSDGGSLFTTPIAGASATSAVRLNPGTTAGEISEIDTGAYSLTGSDVIFSGFTTPVPAADNATRQDTFYRTAADGSTANSPTNIPITNLSDDPLLNFGRFEVTSDGQTIITQGDLQTNGVTELFGISTAGGDFEPLFDAPRPNFDVSFFRLSNDGTQVAFVGDFLTDTVAELFIVPTTGGTPRRVSDAANFLNADGTAGVLDVAFTGAPDRIQFSADDQFLYYVADGGSEGAHDGIFTLHRVSVAAAAIPEPSSLALFALGGLTLGFRRRRS